MFQRILFQGRLTWRLLRDPRVPFLTKVIPFLGFLYVISPIDLIPDIVVGLGQLDDVGIVLLSMQLFERSVPKELVEQHRAELSGKRPFVIPARDYRIYRPGDKRKRSRKS